MINKLINHEYNGLMDYDVDSYAGSSTKPILGIIELIRKGSSFTYTAKIWIFQQPLGNFTFTFFLYLLNLKEVLFRKAPGKRFTRPGTVEKLWRTKGVQE